LIWSTYRKHLVGLIEDEELDSIGLESTALDHVVNTSRGTDNDVDTILEDLHVLTDNGTTNASMALNVHEVTNGDNNLLDLLSELTSGSQNQSLALLDAQIDLLKNGDGESGGLSGTGLSLGNNVTVWREC
jgi:hypothetical protein